MTSLKKKVSQNTTCLKSRLDRTFNLYISSLRETFRTLFYP